MRGRSTFNDFLFHAESMREAVTRAFTRIRALFGIEATY